jgi:glycosyltransferase involved in cell wall biosynthesis
MCVLMTADPLTGVWAYALELIGALAEHDVDVVLATMGAPLSPAQRREVYRLPNVSLAESRHAVEWMEDPWREVDAAADWLRGLEQRHAPDVIHVNGFAHAAVRFDAPVLCAAHACKLTWMRAVRGCAPGRTWGEYRARVARGLLKADELVAPTDAILEAILGAHGVIRSGRVIPHGRAAAAFPPGKKEPFVLAAGRPWDEEQGQAELEACAGQVRWPISRAACARSARRIRRCWPGGWAARRSTRSRRTTRRSG